MSTEHIVNYNSYFTGLVEVAQGDEYYNCTFNNCEFVGYPAARFVKCVFIGTQNMYNLKRVEMDACKS